MSPQSPRTPHPTGGGNQPGQGRQPQPAARLVADPAHLAAQDHVFAQEQLEDGNDHLAISPAGKIDQARSNNRAPHGPATGFPVLRPRPSLAHNPVGTP